MHNLVVDDDLSETSVLAINVETLQKLNNNFVWVSIVIAAVKSVLPDFWAFTVFSFITAIKSKSSFVYS